MIKWIQTAVVLMGVLSGATVSARNETLYLPIADVLNSADAKEKLDGSVAFHFGQSKGGKILKAQAVSNKKTNAFNKTDEEACQRAMLSALISFQSSAKKMGATRVNDLTSFYDKQEYTSKDKYECHAGSFVAGVTLRGDIAQ